jgi:hypothetical protein
MLAALIAFATHALVTHLAVGLGGWFLHRIVAPRLLALLPAIGSALLRAALRRIL